MRRGKGLHEGESNTKRGEAHMERRTQSTGQGIKEHRVQWGGGETHERVKHKKMTVTWEAG